MDRFEPGLPARVPSFGQAGTASEGVFFGPLGLRAGWGLLLYLLLVFAFVALLFVGLFKVTGQAHRALAERRGAHAAAQQARAAHLPVPQHAERLRDVGLAETAEAGGVLAAGVGLALLERRRFAVYGLGLSTLGQLVPGALCGLAAISGFVGLLRALHLLVFDGRLEFGAGALQYGMAWLLVFVLVGVFEEFLFRGYLQFTLMRGLLGVGAQLAPVQARKVAFWIAALLWSILFSLTHLGNADEGPMGIVMVFAAGLLFSYALWRTGSLWWGVGFHMAWDWGQSFLFGVPDSGTLSAGRLFSTHPAGSAWLSGGRVGPEGSVLVLPVLMLVAVVIRLHPQAQQPPVEPASLPFPLEPDVQRAIP